jgi:DNA-binding HxlR family transcriptional regulator
MAIKTSTKHPYAAIEHRVIDSEAYRNLTFSARSLLTLMARQLTRDNNGHLQATYTFLRHYGFDSERTISRCLKELIAKGLLHRTRYGGYQQGASQYAVTWLSIRKREGLFLDGFKSCAWRDWRPPEEKNTSAKMQEATGKNGILSPSPDAKNAARTPRKNADNELMPIGAQISALSAPRQEARATARILWMPQIAGGRLPPIQLRAW